MIESSAASTSLKGVVSSATIKSVVSSFRSESDCSHAGMRESRRDDTLEKLLRDAQSQVRELLPHREENVRLATELTIQKDIAISKEEEIKKLQRMLLQERTERQQQARKSTDDHSAVVHRSDSKVRALEERISELQAEVQGFTRDLERKDRHAKHLEEEISQMRTQRGEERGKAQHRDALMATAELERNRSTQQCEELSRANAKLEQAKRLAEQQVSALKQDVDTIRMENETLHRQKMEVQAELTQCQSLRDSALRRIESLNDEVSNSQQLRTNLMLMEPLKEEVALLRKSVETSESAVSNERLARRNADAERDQLTAKVRGLEMNIRRLEADCHRAQCEAAERVPLRRENEDLQQALQETHGHLASLQEELSRERSLRLDERQRNEHFITVLSRETQALRAAAETKECSETFAQRVSHGERLGVSADRARSALPRQAAVASPIQPSTFISSFSGAPVGNADGNDALNQSTDHRPSAALSSITNESEEQVAAILQPAKRAVMELIGELKREQSRRVDVSKQFADEQRRNSTLELNVQRTDRTLTQEQLNHAAASEREQQAVRQLRATEEELHRLKMLTREEALKVYSLLMVTDGVSSSLQDADYGSLFQHLMEAARLAVRQRDLEHRHKLELESEVGRLKHQQEESQRHHAALVEDTEMRCQQQVRELHTSTQAQIDETVKLHADLRAAVQLAVERYEHLSEEHRQLQAKLHETLLQATEAETSLQNSRRELELTKREASMTATLLQKEKIAASEAAAVVSRLEQEISSLTGRNEGASLKLHDAQDQSDRLQKVIVLLGQLIIGQTDAIQTLSTERYWSMQYGLSLEQSMRSLMAACPEDRSCTVPKHSVRRDVQCPRMIRYGSLRPVVIAVIAALRIQTLYFAARSGGSQTLATNSTKMSGISHVWDRRSARAGTNGRRVYLPVIEDASTKVIVSAICSMPASTLDLQPASSPTRLRLATRQQPWHVEAALQSIVGVFLANATTHSACKRSYSLLWDLASGLATRNVLTIGMTGQCKLAAATLKHQLRSVGEACALAEHNLLSVKRENTSLVEMIQLKEQHLQRLSDEVSVLQREKLVMVDRDQLRAIEDALHSTQEELVSERAHHRQAEDRIAFMRSNEGQLLIRQNELQNESRSLAIELARKTAMMSALSPRVPSPSVDVASRKTNEEIKHATPSAPNRSPSPKKVGQHGALNTESIYHQHHVLQRTTTMTKASPVGWGGATQLSAQRGGVGATAFPSSGASYGTELDVMTLIRGIDEKISVALRQ